MSARKKRCEGLTWDGRHERPCGNHAAVEYSGRAYCRVHDPVRRAAKDAARNAESDRLAQRRALVSRMEKAERAVTDLATEYYESDALPRPLDKAVGELREARAALVALDSEKREV